ncbi:MAG: sigma 54-interacting transcriptional regulator [Myxococcota bacterium]|nr:sigma 54-interacting transcriptional regulator [Myxococcota bacterium]
MKQHRNTDANNGLAGRFKERELINKTLERLNSGQQRGAAIMISGSAGIGKSKLVDSLKREVRQHGHAILECECTPKDDRPNGVFIELFARGAQLIVDAGGDPTPLESAIDVLAGLRTGKQVTAARSIGDGLYLRETVRRALLDVVTPAIPVIIIRDLHWADQTTITIIRYLFENLLTDPAFEWTPTERAVKAYESDNFRGLVITSFRETSGTQSLVQLAAETNAIEHISLAGLSRAGVKEFLVADEVVDKLVEASKGVPQKLISMIQHACNPKLQHVGSAPPAFSEDQSRLLDILAVVDKPCSQRQLEILAPKVSRLKVLLEHLTREGVLRRDLVNGRPSFRFSNHGASESWYNGIPLATQKTLHQRVADLYAAQLESEPEMVANHYLAAGLPADAVPYAIAASHRLEAALALERAVELLEQVIGVTDGDLETDLIDRLANLYAQVDNPKKGRAYLTLLKSRRPGDACEIDARTIRLLNVQGLYAEAEKLATESMATNPGPDQELVLLDLGADAAYRRGDLKAAEALCQNQNKPSLMNLVSDAALGLRNTLGKVYLFREEFESAKCLFQLNLRLAETSDLQSQQAKALINLGVVQLQQGDPDNALDHFEKARHLAQLNGDLANLSIALENLAVLYHRQQAFRNALLFYHQSTVASRRMGRRLQLTTSALNLADLYLMVGDIDRAHRLADIANEYIQANNLRFLENQQLMLAGDISRALGQPEKAGQLYRDAIAQIDRGEQTNQRLGSLLWAHAELDLELERLESAQSLIDRALALPSLTSESLAVRLRMTQGAIYAAQGEVPKAIIELEAAVSGAVEGEDREAVWQARYRLATAYWSTNDTEAARTLMSRALEVIERVAAELPSELRKIYREAPVRKAVRDSLRLLRAGMPQPAADKALEHGSARRQPPGEYRSAWLDRYPHIIGRSPALFPVFKALDRVSGSDSMVLVRGESGTGKELVACALHAHSQRRDGPFIKVNCAAFVESLLLSELFGHEKGAFTGAVNTKKGRFELAHGGTLFLDEIGDISANTQVALLRVLQEGAFERVGGQETISVDVRVICATHRNLEKMVKEGSFRADLYYRLRGVIIEVPALRDRATDIPLLVQHFLRRELAPDGTTIHFDHNALASLFQHDWPGNIRELENVVRSATLFADTGTVTLRELGQLGDILPAPSEAAIMALTEALAVTDSPESANQSVHFTGPYSNTDDGAAKSSVAAHGPSEGSEFEDWLETMINTTGSLSELKKHIEFEAISAALRKEKGNITRAAKRLGIKRPRLSQIIHANIDLGLLKEQLTDSE